MDHRYLPNKRKMELNDCMDQYTYYFLIIEYILIIFYETLKGKFFVKAS